MLYLDLDLFILHNYNFLSFDLHLHIASLITSSKNYLFVQTMLYLFVVAVAFNFQKLISHFSFTMLQSCEMDGTTNKETAKEAQWDLSKFQS